MSISLRTKRNAGSSPVSRANLISRGGMANAADCKPALPEFDSQREIHGGVSPAAWTSVLKTDDTARYGDRHCHPSSISRIINRSSGRHSLLKSWCLHGHGDQDLSYPPNYVWLAERRLRLTVDQILTARWFESITTHQFAPVAQLDEHPSSKGTDAGSTPVGSTTIDFLTESSYPITMKTNLLQLWHQPLPQLGVKVFGR